MASWTDLKNGVYLSPNGLHVITFEADRYGFSLCYESKQFRKLSINALKEWTYLGKL